MGCVAKYCENCMHVYIMELRLENSPELISITAYFECDIAGVQVSENGGNKVVSYSSQCLYTALCLTGPSELSDICRYI